MIYLPSLLLAPLCFAAGVALLNSREPPGRVAGIVLAPLGLASAVDPSCSLNGNFPVALFFGVIVAIQFAIFRPPRLGDWFLRQWQDHPGATRGNAGRFKASESTPLADQPPKRFCLSCGYPLDHLGRDECPECGRRFDPNNPATWRASPHRLARHLVAPLLLGSLACSASFLVLFTLQWGFISWWHATITLLWFDDVRGGSWWVLVGPGEWMYPLQQAVLLCWSGVFGVLVARHRYRRDRTACFS